jgi:hypothetical protein
MSIQNIMWTALPNGLNAAGDRLRLSVLVSPRLVTNTPVGSLAEFPDFLDWPATVAGLKFTVEFQGGSSVAAAPVTEPGFPALDPSAWQALFHKDIPVNSYGFDDRSDLPVRSFPTKKVFSFLTNTYQTIATRSATQMPSLADLGFNPDLPGIVQLNSIAISAGIQERLEVVISDLLKEFKAVPANFGTPQTDFLQLRLMHQPLSKIVFGADHHPLPLPKQQLPDVDFHKAVAGLGQYPKLMRALGLAIDLEVPLAGVPAAANVRVHPSLAATIPMVPWTAYTLNIAQKLFLAAAAGPASDVTDGMLFLSGPDLYDIVEMDIDGGAEKAMDFANNMARLETGEAKRSIDTPTNYGLPSLQSAGFSAARVDRATRLVNVFDGAKSNNTAITANPQNSGVVLHAEDITRGYRVDVWNSLSGKWHSLHLRNGTYQFLDGPLSRSFSDEGFATVATSHSADGTTTDLRLPESLFRWAGWSLSAPRVGRTIGSDSTPQDATNPATTAIKLQAGFTVQKNTLPRLRFGAHYQFRARAVDLAGNSFAPDAVLSDIYNLPPRPIRYLRYEPVVAPAIVLRQALGPVTTPGESGNRIVIRSNYNTHIAALSERHIAPPKTTEIMAETHGMLDTPAGPPDKSVYGMLVAKDGSFPTNTTDPSQPVPFPGPQLSLPYLPDPFAAGAAFATLPGMSAGAVFQAPFTGIWPDTRPFRFVLDEGSGAPQFTENATERVLHVRLSKAEMVTVAMTCFVTDDPASKPPNMLSTLKLWSLIVAANPPDLADLRTLALNGGHWMLTPPRLLTLVHAVQQPLIDPEFQNLQAAKVLGQTFATLTDEFPIDGKSTIKVDIQATWQDPVDDLSDNTQPVIQNGAVRAFEVPVEVGDIVCDIDDTQGAIRHFSSKHEFHDTRHRNVTYTAVATTRFKEYFPDTLTANPANVTRTSVPATVSVLNSARPAAPVPLYVLPSFGWSQGTDGSWTVSRRSGGGLRVYLDRPWFSSGEGELLAAVLRGNAPPPGAAFDGWEMPDSLKGFVTQWGKDPIWSAAALPSQAMPLVESFTNAVAVGTELTLDELSNTVSLTGAPLIPLTPFTAVGHKVGYDADHGRKLWYCDIEMNMGSAYFPFVRLALARYQPQSLPDAHLSRVVLADFIQLLPDRSASITFDSIDTTSLRLAVNGLTHSGPGAAEMTATLQTQPVTGGDGTWVPLLEIALTPHVFGGPDTLWTAQITLPSPRGTRPFRLLIQEHEVFQRDVPGSQQRRLVYGDILDL